MIKLFILGSLFSFSDSTHTAQTTNISNLNQFHSQYFPQFNAAKNEIYFTVRNKKGDHEDLYVSQLNQGIALPSKPIETLNNDFFNEGTCSFTEDGETMVFSACDYPNSKGGCDLYESQWKNNQWSTPKNLGFFINSREWDGQPHVTNKRKTIYFSSERAGGYGGRDIWVSDKDQNGVWGIPKNLGPNINSKANEIGPFLNLEKQILVFSSDRHGGKGKLDFYQSQHLNNEWQIAKNLEILNNEEDNAGICKGPLEMEYFITESSPTKSPTERIYAVLIHDSIWLKEPKQVELQVSQKAKIQFSEISFSDIYFDQNKWELPSTIPQSLHQLTQFLQENPNQEILIEGHSDETGNPKNNIILSEKRALSIKNYLINQGISAVRMQTKGHGHLKPKSKQLAGNRRIEVKLF